MSSSDETDEDIPPVEECGKLCESFAEITGTDTACAQFYLQDRKWDLQRSVNDFFEDSGINSASRISERDESDVVIVVEEKCLERKPPRHEAAATPVLSRNTPDKNARSIDGNAEEASLTDEVDKVEEENLKELKFITWNVDGLNEKNLMRRTKAVCKRILFEKADVVFLQEVVSEAAVYYLTHLTDYECVFGNTVGYFVGTLLKKKTVKLLQSDIIDFPSTRMMRNLLRIDATYGEVPLCLMNSHLESSSEASEERKQQLRSVLRDIVTVPDDCTVIFAGDMNLRDKELDELGGLPTGVEDVWVVCGSRKECSYTWDMTRNDNLMYNSRFKPRCRFDRIYIRGSSPSKLTPKYFGLIGLERLLPYRCFPSDHWGILSHFDVK